METEGVFSFEDAGAVRETYAALGPAARTVVRETARAMDFDGEEYGARVTGEVVETARDALFASLLEVRVGTREEYESWREGYDGDVHETGSRRVDRVAWHAPPFADVAVATTFQDEREAATGTLRRQAFGRIYRDVLYGGEDAVGSDTDADTDGNDAGADTDGNDADADGNGADAGDGR